MESGAATTIRGSSLGEYYEYLIRHALLSAQVEARDLDAVLNYLTEMGYCFVEQRVNHLDSGGLAQFDANFSRRYAVNMRFDSLHKQLQEADILEQWNDQVRFKYRYVLLFFGAKYLAKHYGRDDEVSRQVRAVARNSAIAKYADLMLFIVHHSSDPAVLDLVIQEAAKRFQALAPMRLDNEDLEPINSLAHEVPKLVLKEEGCEERRQRDLQRRDQEHRVQRQNAAADVSDMSLGSLRDDGIEDALDFVQRMSYAFRLLGILGQVMRNHYGSLLAERKEEIASTSYALVGRMIRSYLNLLVEDRDGLRDFITDQLSERQVTNREKARLFANRFIFGFSSFLTFTLIKRAAEFLGSDKLLPTHQKVADALDTPLSRLLGLAISLAYPAANSSGGPRLVPLAVLEEFSEEFRNNPCASYVLRRLIRDYLYMFEVSFKDKQRICDSLGIGIEIQQQIQWASDRKRRE